MSGDTKSGTIFKGSPPPNPTDYRKIIELRGNGDPPTWAEFVKDYGPFVYRACQGFGLRGEPAHLVATNVMGKVFQLLRDGKKSGDPAFEPPKEERAGSFRRWLKMVIYREVCDFFAAETVFTALPDYQSDDGAEPSQTASSHETSDAETNRELAMRRLNAFLEAKNFKPNTGAYLVERVMRGRPWADIARDHGVTVDAAKSAVRRALQALKEHGPEAFPELSFDG